MRRAAILATLIALSLVAGCDDDDETTTSATGTTGVPGATGSGEAVDGSEGGDEQGASPEVAITQNVKQVIGDDDVRSVCDFLVTAPYLRDAYGSEQGCRSAQAAEGTFEVRVRRIEVTDSTATAVAIPLGGPNEGIETDVELVLDGDVWRVDRLRADVPAGP